MQRSLALASLLVAAGCSTLPAGASRTTVRDIHSSAEPNRVRVTHASLDLTLDFREHMARGSVDLTLQRADRTAPLVVDTNELIIEEVTGVNGSARAWSLGKAVARLGQPLTITLHGADERVRIRYHTSPSSEAMQWLAPEQTAGGKQPFLFTQGQSILTRSWIPLQDSPGVRITYDARIRCPDGLTAVMSAERLGQDSLGAWRFRMQQAIPPYLIALACGDLAFRELSQRCGVWAEPSVVEKARWELEDTERMVQAAEALFGPYRWGRYDLIVLPPSFPFGGMENPTLTFATPTILAGDRSLVALVAHELAHSWSGNLATNATWNDFWLNEGFTVYCENRIMEVLYGKERAATELALEVDKLRAELATMEPWQQVLHADLTGRHPDDSFSEVPYTKGALFLVRLETIAGRERWDKFLRGYFDRHAFQSVTTQDFLDDLARELPDAAKSVDLALWTEGTGLPPDAPSPKTKSLDAVNAQVAAWEKGTAVKGLSTDDWTTQQWLLFIRGISSFLTPEGMSALDKAFNLSVSPNFEIKHQWLMLSIKKHYEAANPEIASFLDSVGRRKFVVPMYQALAETTEGKAFARSIYRSARPKYHFVVTIKVDSILDWTASAN